MTTACSSPTTSEPISESPAAVRRPRRSPWWQVLLLYLAAAALSLGSAAYGLGLLHADLHTPFAYEGDAAFNLMTIKVMLEKGWYFQTDALGAPAEMTLQDFPAVDNLVMAMIKVMSIFCSDPAMLSNLFFLFTFPLVSWSALHAARQFGLSTWPALLVSYLYALLPYHFFRGTVHLFYTAYFLVPSAVLIAWWISSGTLFARRWRVWFSLGMGVLLGCNMVYYPFFACFLFCVAVVIALARRDFRHCFAGGFIIATVSAVVLLNLMPTFLYTHSHGHNISGKRYSRDAEVSGLKIVQLLLPTSGHRVPALARLKNDYNLTNPMVNENDMASLGFIGGAGFLALTGWLLFVRRRAVLAAPPPLIGATQPLVSDAPEQVLPSFGQIAEHLSIFNGATVLLCTFGGFSVLFAVLITPQIRAYNRMSTFVAFCALLMIAAGLDWTARRWVRSRPAAVAFVLVVALIGWLGYLDQVGGDAFHDWLGMKRSYRNDRRYFEQVQAALPVGSMVYQLPYEPFPEYGSTMHRMIEYALFLPYLHTHGLRWSYGAIKGRAGDEWASNTALQPAEQMIQTLHQTGFAAIYIDRFGYADYAPLEDKLQSILGAPLVDASGRFSLFKLPALAAPPPSPATFRLLLPAWTAGFYGTEYSADHAHSWHWCVADGEARFFNDTGISHHLRLQATFSTGNPEPATLRIDSASFDETLTIDTAAVIEWSRTIDVPPGTTTLHFHCSGKPVSTNGLDARTLIWRIDDLKTIDAE